MITITVFKKSKNSKNQELNNNSLAIMYASEFIFERFELDQYKIDLDDFIKFSISTFSDIYSQLEGKNYKPLKECGKKELSLEEFTVMLLAREIVNKYKLFNYTNSIDEISTLFVVKYLVFLDQLSEGDFYE